jgi:hypothetical protein
MTRESSYFEIETKSCLSSLSVTLNKTPIVNGHKNESGIFSTSLLVYNYEYQLMKSLEVQRQQFDSPN